MAMNQRVGEVHLTSEATQEVAALTAAACLFNGFSDRSRLAIVQHLIQGEHRVVDLTGHLGLAQSTVSRHLACLLDCGIVQVRAEGRASMYSLAHPEATLLRPRGLYGPGDPSIVPRLVRALRSGRLPRLTRGEVHTELTGGQRHE